MTDKIKHGTPPRLWGKRRSTAQECGDCRYTPTPVGKTLYDFADSVHLTVHPHACGENSPDSRTKVPSSGTPPRLWGKPSAMP